MVETWLWPKASYSVLSICWAVTPKREAVARSMTSVASRPLSCWSLLTSVNPCNVTQLWRAPGAPSAPVRQNRRPAACIGTARRPCARRCARPAPACRIQRGAGHAGQLGPQPRDDVVDVHLALAERLQGDEHAADVGGALPPKNAVAPSTAGSAMTMPTICPIFWFMDWKEIVLVGHAPVRFRRPISCCGKKPLGTVMYK